MTHATSHPPNGTVTEFLKLSLHWLRIEREESWLLIISAKLRLDAGLYTTRRRDLSIGGYHAT